MKKTKLGLALLLSATMAASLTACSGGGTTEPTKEPAPSETQKPKETEVETETEFSGFADTGVKVESGKGLDFEDGKCSFAILNTVISGGAEGTLSVADFNGSKALKAEVSDRTISRAESANDYTGSASPYIAISAAGLLGDRAKDVASVQADVGVVYETGEFGAASGTIYGGNSKASTSKAFTVLLETKNPRTVKLEGIEFSGTAEDIIMISLTNFGNPASSFPTVYVDNVIFYDKDGKAIEIADPSYEITEAALGVLDWSNSTVKPATETDLGIKGAQTENGWWPIASNSLSFDKDAAELKKWTYVDPATIKPGMVFTIYFTTDVDAVAKGGWWQVPYFRCQQWDDLKEDGSTEVIKTYDNPIKFAKTDFAPKIGEKVDEVPGEDTKVNKSWNIAQVSYEEIAELTGDEEWPYHTQFFGVADMGMEVTIDKVTIGTPGVYGEEIMITDASGTSSGWGQAVNFMTVKNDGGTFDPAVIVPGTTFKVTYSAEDADPDQPAPLELIFQSWTDGNKVGWAKIAPYAFDESTAYFSYDDAVKAFGTDDFVTYLDKVYVGDCNSKLTFYSLSYIVEK